VGGSRGRVQHQGCFPLLRRPKRNGRKRNIIPIPTSEIRNVSNWLLSTWLLAGEAPGGKKGGGTDDLVRSVAGFEEGRGKDILLNFQKHKKGVESEEGGRVNKAGGKGKGKEQRRTKHQRKRRYSKPIEQGLDRNRGYQPFTTYNMKMMIGGFFGGKRTNP